MMPMKQTCAMPFGVLAAGLPAEPVDLSLSACGALIRKQDAEASNRNMASSGQHLHKKKKTHTHTHTHTHCCCVQGGFLGSSPARMTRRLLVVWKASKGFRLQSDPARAATRKPTWGGHRERSPASAREENERWLADGGRVVVDGRAAHRRSPEPAEAQLSFEGRPEKLLAPDLKDKVSCSLGQALTAQGKPQEAEKVLRQVIKESHNPHSRDTARRELGRRWWRWTRMTRRARCWMALNGRKASVWPMLPKPAVPSGCDGCCMFGTYLARKSQIAHPKACRQWPTRRWRQTR